jgi:hypothetical protein
MAQFRNFYRCARCSHEWTDEWRRNATTTARTVVRGICRRTKAKMWRTTMNNISALTKTQRIRELNDALRTTFVGGKVMLTAGVDALPPEEKATVLQKVRTFTDFNTDNDPHGEHDMVFVEVQGERYFAKCDYYDLNLEYGSEDPSDPAKTTRVLTIGHMSDY